MFYKPSHTHRVYSCKHIQEKKSEIKRFHRKLTPTGHSMRHKFWNQKESQPYQNNLPYKSQKDCPNHY